MQDPTQRRMAEAALERHFFLLWQEAARRQVAPMFEGLEWQSGGKASRLLAEAAAGRFYDLQWEEMKGRSTESGGVPGIVLLESEVGSGAADGEAVPQLTEKSDITPNQGSTMNPMNIVESQWPHLDTIENERKTIYHPQGKKHTTSATKIVKNPDTSDIMVMLQKDAFHSLSNDVIERSAQVNKLLDRHCAKRSKWSGKTVVKSVKEMPKAMGTKEWSCAITLREDSGIKTAVHEHLHARSCSYYPSEVYVKWQRAEEGVVELLAQEICKKNGIDFHEAYKPIVKQLRIACSILRIYDTEYEFAKVLFDVDLPNRYSWLRSKADKLIAEGKLSSKTIKALNIAVNSIAGR